MLSANALITLVLNRLKEPTDGTGHYTRPNVLERLNLSQDQVSTDIPNLIIDEDKSLSTVTNQSNYTIPSDVNKIITVRVDGKPLDEDTEKSLDRDSQRGVIMEDWKTDETGEPTHWYRRKNELFLFPTPTSAYSSLVITILHELILTELTDSTSSYPLENIAWLRQAQILLVLETAKSFALDDSNYNLADRLEAEYDKKLDTLKTNLLVLKESGVDSLCKERINEDDEGEIGFNYEYK